MSVYKSIRGALETTLIGVSSIPRVVPDNVNYTPITGVPYVVSYFDPYFRKPAVRGTSPRQEYRGSYNLLVYSPYGGGPGASDDIAELILAAFEATTDLTFTSGGVATTVNIRSSERKGSTTDGSWFITPVEVQWYNYS